ncbi:hypothetical protein PMI35_00753 [Pseudomonas sp. GM78]|nr:hypothetical protein PMI35_00753 [Pseudomonas sp. GM78]
MKITTSLKPSIRRRRRYLPQEGSITSLCTMKAMLKNVMKKKYFT